MNAIKKNEAFKKAKEMMLKGEEWQNIMKETSLRLKDLKRIQREQISNHF